MASDDAPDKRADQRHPFGPRPVGALMPRLTRPAFRTRAPAAAQVMADWAEIVGPTLADATVPRRLSAGTLTLACAGPVALELQHLAGPLIERINAHLGRVLIQRLRFVQDATVRTAPATLARLPPAPPVEVPGVPPGPLRDALAALGARLGTVRRASDGDPA
ncbi:MAG: hypothetical protein NVSMB18_05550 [Acetobacteraceae bacterium]